MVKMHPSNALGLRKPGSLFATCTQQSRCPGERSVSEFQTLSVQAAQGNYQASASLTGLIIADRFKIIGDKAIGSGSGGDVWEAIDLTNENHIALKRIHQKRVKERARETKISRDHSISLNPMFVAPLSAVIDSRFHDVLFVSTSMRKEGDLRNLLHFHGSFRLKTARSALADLLISLNYLHTQKGIIHRDVKPENLYWDGKTCRLGDFGLARKLTKNEMMTPQMVTLWYRAPEVLLGTRCYNMKVDIFSAGAVFGELLIGKPIFKGHSEIDQIKLIFDLLGFPVMNQQGWPFDIMTTLENFFINENNCGSGGSGGGGGGDEINKDRWSRLADKMPFGTPVSALDLMFKLLAINPAHRPTARDALLHPFFWEEPKVAQWRSTSAASINNDSSKGVAAELADDDDDEDPLASLPPLDSPPPPPPLLTSESSGGMKDSPVSAFQFTSFHPSLDSLSLSTCKIPSSNIPMDRCTILGKKSRTKLFTKIRPGHRHYQHHQRQNPPANEKCDQKPMSEQFKIE